MIIREATSEMESFSDQWLESIGREKYAPLFSSHGYTTFAKCAQLTEEELTSVGVTDDARRKNILEWVVDLQGRQEADVIRQLPVSVLPTELSIISSNTPLTSGYPKKVIERSIWVR